jgi:ABC-type multidrug transport system fused ATPase/permease subunit
LAQRLQWLLPVLAAIGGIALFQKIASALQNYYFTRFQQEVSVTLQEELLNRLLHFPKAFFDQTQTGYLMSRLTGDLAGIQWFFSSIFVQIFSQVLYFAGGAVLLLYLEWRLALVALGSIPFAWLAVYYFSSKLYVLGHHNSEKRAQVSRRLQETLSTLPLIKAFTTEQTAAARVIEEVTVSNRLQLEQATVSSVAGLTNSLLPALMHLVTLGAGAWLVISGRWTLGSMLAFQAYLAYVFGPIQFLAGSSNQLHLARASLDRVAALFRIAPEPETPGGRKADKLSGKIEFRQVSFAYQPERPILADVSFTIEPGEKVAIVGASGVGKTSLLSLLLGFYLPSGGKILFDDIELTAFQLKSLRQRLGYVSQRPLLLSGTIAENLRYGQPGATDQEVETASRYAESHAFIASLPAGYQTELGEKGVNLSEGQQQRLALARALLKHPDILLLDEPAAALDNTLAAALTATLRSVTKGKTVLTVTHTVATAAASDRVLFFQQGRLLAAGPHAELMRTGAGYREFFRNPA